MTLKIEKPRMVTRLVVVIISPCSQILNRYIVDLKLTHFCISFIYTSVCLKIEKLGWEDFTILKYLSKINVPSFPKNKT